MSLAFLAFPLQLPPYTLGTVPVFLYSIRTWAVQILPYSSRYILPWVGICTSLAYLVSNLSIKLGRGPTLLLCDGPPSTSKTEVHLAPAFSPFAFASKFQPDNRLRYFAPHNPFAIGAQWLRYSDPGYPSSPPLPSLPSFVHSFGCRA